LLPFDFSFEWFEKPGSLAVACAQTTVGFNQRKQIKTYTFKESVLFVDK
jgi:hypothetical protein